MRGEKHVQTIAIANQKRGVGKTPTTVNLGFALARAGKRILLIDLDPQGSLSEYFFQTKQTFKKLLCMTLYCTLPERFAALHQR